MRIARSAVSLLLTVVLEPDASRERIGTLQRQ